MAASTEAEEFNEIYGLGVVEIPTNRPIAREDEDDQIYRTAREKFEGVVKEIKEANAKGQPVLVGTTSIERSEFISEVLTKDNIPHNVLNARQHEQEAQIVADAGKPGAVTIATNMAGRGTDIQLGGNVEMRVMAALAEVMLAESICSSPMADASGEPPPWIDCCRPASRRCASK